MMVPMGMVQKADSLLANKFKGRHIILHIDKFYILMHFQKTNLKNLNYQ